MTVKYLVGKSDYLESYPFEQRGEFHAHAVPRVGEKLHIEGIRLVVIQVIWEQYDGLLIPGVFLENTY